MKQSKLNKKYKLLLLDIDGTLVPYDYTALPSENVKKAIKKAQEKLMVCLVTGRAYNYAEEILKTLEINKGFVVINNGANVVDIATKEFIYDQPMDLKEARRMVEILSREKIPFYLKDTFDFKSTGTHPLKKAGEIKKAYMIFTKENLPIKKVERVIKELSSLPHLNAYKSRHKYPDKLGIVATHVDATKTQGILTLEKKLKIKQSDMIGVGDGYNDFPLLMACGLKVAMGNAVDDLKAIADYIAPSVEEDGVVDIIEKFIFKK